MLLMEVNQMIILYLFIQLQGVSIDVEVKVNT